MLCLVMPSPISQAGSLPAGSPLVQTPPSCCAIFKLVRSGPSLYHSVSPLLSRSLVLSSTALNLPLYRACLMNRVNRTTIRRVACCCVCGRMAILSKYKVRSGDQGLALSTVWCLEEPSAALGGGRKVDSRGVRLNQILGII